MVTQLAVTGARGYLGQALLTSLNARSGIVSITTLGRTPVPNYPNIAWDITGDISLAGEMPAMDCIVHMAWALTPRTAAVAKRNIAASGKLLQLARERDAVMVFISSMSANATSVSHYGHAKWVVEQNVVAYKKGIVIRPGVIASSEGYGMLDQTLEKAANLPIAIEFRPDKMVPIVSRSKVTEVIESALTGPVPLGQSGSPETIDCVDRWESLGQLVREQRVKPPRFTIHVSEKFATLGAKIAHRIPLSALRDPADSWLGLQRNM
jgi:dTDP-4-dehydrorhamnose reductase